jgi:hypothetical protein
MSRNPREYRVYATECAELASSARTPELQVMFSELSDGWERLALDIEETDALLAESEGVATSPALDDDFA